MLYICLFHLHYVLNAVLSKVTSTYYLVGCLSNIIELYVRD